MSYKTCPDCGANLDAGERCDCQKSEAEKEFLERMARMNAAIEKSPLVTQRAGKITVKLSSPLV